MVASVSALTLPVAPAPGYKTCRLHMLDSIKKITVRDGVWLSLSFAAPFATPSSNISMRRSFPSVHNSDIIGPILGLSRSNKPRSLGKITWGNTFLARRFVNRLNGSGAASVRSTAFSYCVCYSTLTHILAVSMARATLPGKKYKREDGKSVLIAKAELAELPSSATEDAVVIKKREPAPASRPRVAEALPAWLEDCSVDNRRIRLITRTKSEPKITGKSVVCYLQRDMRVQDNWALLLASEAARELKVPLHVVHVLVAGLAFQPTPRHLAFFFEGAREVEEELKSLNIGFHLPVAAGENSEEKVKAALREFDKLFEFLDPSIIISDSFPLRLASQVIEALGKLCDRKKIPLYQVDAHGVVPVWVASSKVEVAARTLRPRLMAHLPEFLTEFPVLQRQSLPPLSASASAATAAASWLVKPSALAEAAAALGVRGSVPAPVKSLQGGTRAAHQQLQQFCDTEKLGVYASQRNDPFADAQSNLSPYLHFGHIAQQRCILQVYSKTRSGGSSNSGSEVARVTEGVGEGSTGGGVSKSVRPNDSKARVGLKNARLRSSSKPSEKRSSSSGRSVKAIADSVSSFLEEAFVRAALSENFVFYCKDYNSLKGAPQWAQQSLNAHRKDVRDPLYSLKELEVADTYDALWNAAHLQLLHWGKMHGYLRMYWAKKILEWMATPEEALAACIYFNDKYSLDGTDPNGYVGCLWSVGGLHDRPFRERPIFGKIRYMTYGGCERKFDVAAFIQKTRTEVSSGSGSNSGKKVLGQSGLETEKPDKIGGNKVKLEQSSSTSVNRDSSGIRKRSSDNRKGDPAQGSICTDRMEGSRALAKQQVGEQLRAEKAITAADNAQKVEAQPQQQDFLGERKERAKADTAKQHVLGGRGRRAVDELAFADKTRDKLQRHRDSQSTTASTTSFLDDFVERQHPLKSK